MAIDFSDISPAAFTYFCEVMEVCSRHRSAGADERKEFLLMASADFQMASFLCSEASVWSPEMIQRFLTRSMQ